MAGRVTETFFLPDEIARHETRIPAPIYNLAHHLLTQSEPGCVFVPIRALQILAVISRNEIVFVDSLSYACHDDEGGRVIVVAWQFDHSRERHGLDEPAACEVIYYDENSARVQERLIVEFRKALDIMDRQYRERAVPAEGAKIVRLRH